LPYEDFTIETDRTWVDWIHEADDPKKNHLKPEALDDLLVLDASEGNVGGLFASSILAEFGADVIRIEPPEGDPARKFTPFGYLTKARASAYLMEGRNKYHITLNLKKPEAQEAFRRLAGPGRRDHRILQAWYIMDGWGLSYRHLKEINPRLIYATIYTYGHFGVLSQAAGSLDYDICDQARSGVMAVTGEAEGPDGPKPWTVPTKEGN